MNPIVPIIARTSSSLLNEANLGNVQPAETLAWRALKREGSQ